MTANRIDNDKMYAMNMLIKCGKNQIQAAFRSMFFLSTHWFWLYSVYYNVRTRM